MSNAFPEAPPRAWAEIDLNALRHNLGVARALSPDCQIMAVVKADAYGHGLERLVRVLADEQIAFFGVANAGEARRIAATGVTTPIYLLGATWADERAEIVARGWVPCLSSLDEARHFDALAAAAAVKLKAHLAIDTGMGRGGFVASELSGAMADLQRLGHLQLDGFATHLSSADEDPVFTEMQVEKFTAALEALGGADQFTWRHVCNSAGLLGYRVPGCNLVRPGLMLYGIAPFATRQSELVPVMTLKSRISLVRTLPAGHGVSYGKAFITTHPTRVATIGIGYGDGYPRHVSGKGAEVWIRGRRFPVLGRVTMDQMMLDVTGAEDIIEGDEVELFGKNVLVTELASKADTIPWEIFTGIMPRVTRVYR